jgi:xylulokinase
MASSGSLLKWVVEQCCEADLLTANRAGRNVFEDLNQKARDIPPGSEGVVILPYFLGAKTPLNDTAARGLIYGLTLSHNRYHIYRAVMEAVVFGFKHHFEVLQSQGQPVRRVVASEGGARSKLWRQIAADVLQLPIRYLESNPGSALGAAIVAGMGAGMLTSWDQFEQTYPPGEQVFPQPELVQIYEHNYSIYRALYPQLKDLMKAHSE